MKKLLESVAALFLFGLLSSSILQHFEREGDKSPENKSLVPVKVDDKLVAISVDQVKLEGELGRRVDVTINNNIKKLHLNKNFTNHFETKTGPDVVGGFIGMGMLIDAFVRFAAYSQDLDLVATKDQVVEKIISAQLDNGYSGFYKKQNRLWNLSGQKGDNWDIHEMAFIIDGLVTDYQLFGNQSSLVAAIKTADFILTHWHEMPDNYAENVDMHVLDTGLDWAILKLYKVTGEKRFLNFSENIKSLYKWDTPITIGRRPGVSGHMFAYFAMCTAQLELYRLTGDKKLLKQTTNAINFFLADDGLTITGSAGQREIWTNDQDGENELGETCATAYQVRVYESLLRLTGNSIFGDLIERTVFNGLFGAQSPEGDKLRYYTPFEGERHFYAQEHMCCPGNFRRIISELPGMVYYVSENGGVAVNLYSPSSATIALDDDTNVKMHQKTNYPSSGTIEISVSPDKPSTFPVLLRIPSWSTNVKILINGDKWNQAVPPGEFIAINRKWLSDDKIMIDFPMGFRYIKGRKRNSGRVALMRGPVIYGLNLEKNPEATANGKRTFHDLRRILIDPTTLGNLKSDDSVRPGGTAVNIKGWRENHSGKLDRKHEFILKLTEFPDPGNQFIYFKIPDYSIEIDDELMDNSGTRIELH